MGNSVNWNVIEEEVLEMDFVLVKVKEGSWSWKEFGNEIVKYQLLSEGKEMEWSLNWNDL